MSSQILPNQLRVTKVLEHWDQVYKYEAFHEGKKVQLYSLFFTEKTHMLTVAQVAKNLQALTDSKYMKISGINLYSIDPLSQKYNLQILTDYTKTSLPTHMKRVTDRVLRITAREFVLLIQSFVSLLQDLVQLQDNTILFQYIAGIFKCDLSSAIYLNDGFEIIINLLPDMQRLSSIDWGVLNIPLEHLEQSIGVIFEKIISNFVKRISLLLPLKKSKEEVTANLVEIALTSTTFRDDIFVFPERIMNLLFELSVITNLNYEERIEKLAEMLDEIWDYTQEVVSVPLLKYNHAEKHPKTTLKITDEFEFSRFLYNMGLEDSVRIYYPGEFTNFPTQEIKTNEIEKLQIQMVDISLIIFYDITTLNFSSLKHLVLQACGITPETVNLIMKWSVTENLETLDFSGSERHNNIIGPKGCLILAECERLKNLKELNLTCAKIDDVAIGHLCNSPYLNNLEKLDISLNRPITKEGYKLINETPNLKSLNTLNLLSNHIRDEWLEELLKVSENPKKYKSLNLCECALTSRGLDIICLSESTENLEALFIDANDFSTLRDWKAPKVLSNLKKLSAQFIGLADENAVCLFSLLVPGKLEYIDVSFNQNLHLDIEEVSRMKNLKELLIESTMIGEAFLDRLCLNDEPHHLEKISLRGGPPHCNLFGRISKAKLLPKLNFISLNRVTDFQTNMFFLLFPYAETSNNLETLHFFRGSIDALLWRSCLYGGLYFNNLSELKLSGLSNNGNNCLIMLARSEKLERLKTLELVACSVSDLGLQRLATERKLKSLRRLTLCVNKISNRVLKQFLSRSSLCYQLEQLDVTQGITRSKEAIRKLRIYKQKYQPKLAFEI